MMLLAGTPHDSLTANQIIRPDILGFNFSPVQCAHLGIENIRDTYRRALDLKPDYLRLATYPTRPIEETHELLHEAKDRDIPVILAVGGIKYPRWPEFFPDAELKTHLDKKTLTVIGEEEYIFNKVITQIEANIDEFNIYPNITHLQGGNESANNVYVAGGVVESTNLIQKQLEIIKNRATDKQKTIATFSFSLGKIPFIPDKERSIFRMYLEEVDSVGLHIYSRVPIRFFGYLTSGETDFHRAEEWIKEAQRKGKEVWATEVQGEPFERRSPVHIAKRTYPSFDPERMIDLVTNLTLRGFQRQLLWGVEHWIYHANQGHMEWIEGFKKLNAAPKLQQEAA